MIKKPKFWDLKKPNLISYLLLPFTLPILINNFFLKFKSNFKNNNIKTICVGNIYLGGTGKTPSTIKIYEILKELNLEVVTAKKYYTSQLDENILLKNKTQLISLKNRKEIIKKAIEKGTEVIVFDDGLQERNICYDLTFVCFETDTFIGNGHVIPSGPLREKLNSLIKYDGIFLKTDKNISNDQLNLIRKYNPKIEIFETYFEINNLDKFDLSKNYLIFSGIGNPISFKKILNKNKFNIVKEIIFPDHHNYTENELLNIFNLAKNLNAKIVTTEKDFVKLSKFEIQNIDFIDIKLVFKNESKIKDFLKKKIYD